MKITLFLTALVALAGVSFARNLMDIPTYQCYRPVPDCTRTCGNVWSTRGHPELCNQCNRPTQVHTPYPCADFQCPVDDWKCPQCYQAAAKFAVDGAKPEFGRYALAHLCHDVYTKTNDAGSVQCLQSNNDAETAYLCIRGITDYKIEGWASNQWCAMPSGNRDAQAMCMQCLGDMKCGNKWGCNNCLVKSTYAGVTDNKMMGACTDAVQRGADAWAAGECLAKSCEAERQTCLGCLVAFSKGRLPWYNNNTWFCLNPDQAPKPSYVYSTASMA